MAGRQLAWHGAGRQLAWHVARATVAAVDAVAWGVAETAAQQPIRDTTEARERRALAVVRGGDSSRSAMTGVAAVADRTIDRPGRVIHLLI